MILTLCSRPSFPISFPFRLECASTSFVEIESDLKNDHPRQRVKTMWS
ncbi:MAG: hypothetical protein ACI9KE_005335, partial [Polyangiales bacterium]